MSTYITEEEQVEAIKTFLKQNARAIMLGLILFLVIFLGYRYWAWHEITIRTNASMTYENLLAAVSEDDHTKIHAYADNLIQTYGNSIYGDFARLMLAKCDVTESSAESAKVLLKEVVNKGHDPALKQIARLRLARIQLSEKDYVGALATTDKIDDKHYESLVLELRGDVYLAKNDKQKATDTYQQAKVASASAGVTNHLLELKL